MAALSYCLAFFILTDVIVSVSHGQSDASSTTAGPALTTTATTEDPPVFTRPLDRGMLFMYALWRNFLESAVNPPGLQALVDRGVNLSSVPAILDSLQQQTSTWISHYSSYAACAILGVLTALAMLLVGLVVCCCRCAGKCGAKPSTRDGRWARCWRVTLNLLLGCISTVVLIGVVATFIADQLVYEQTRGTGVPATLSQSTVDIDMFKDTTVNSLGRIVTSRVEEAKARFFSQLNRLPEDVKDSLGNSTRAGPALERFVDFGLSLPILQGNLETMNSLPAQIQDWNNSLHDTVARLKANITSDLAVCRPGVILCDTVYNLTVALQVQVDFTNVEDVSLPLLMVTVVNNGSSGLGNLTLLALVLQENFDSIALTINDSTNAVLGDVKGKTNEIQQTFNDFVNETTTTIAQVNLEPARKFINSTLKPPLEEYGHYAYIAANVLSSLALLIVTCYLLALLFGACGERHSDDFETRFCNRGNGACLLMTGVALTFIFWWILMLCTTVLFLGGGLAHTEVCRHLVSPTHTDSVKVLENILMKSLNTSIRVKSVMDNCREDQALYTAAHVDVLYPGLNITNITDLRHYKVRDVIDQVKQVRVDIGNVKILDPVVKNFTDILSDPLENINFFSFHQALGSTIIAGGIQTLIDSLDALALVVNATNPELRDKLYFHREQLVQFHNGPVQTALSLKARLADAVTSAEKIVNDAKLSSLYSDLQTAQDALNTEGNVRISGLINQTADGMYDTLQDLGSSIDHAVRQDVGQCRPLYDAVTYSVVGVCQRFLYPVNAFWFGHGWSLFLLSPAVIIAMVLAGLYRKTEKYKPPDDEHRIINNARGRLPAEGTDNPAFQQDDHVVQGQPVRQGKRKAHHNSTDDVIIHDPGPRPQQRHRQQEGEAYF